MKYKRISYNSYLSLKRHKKSFKARKRKPKNNKKIYYLIFKALITIIILAISFFIIFKNLRKLFSKKKEHPKFHLKKYKVKVDYNNLASILEKNKRKNIIWPLEPYLKFDPKMNYIAIQAFCLFMNPKNIYFEFGSGGSTNIAFFYNLTIYSVESDSSLHENLKNNGIKANYITIDLKTYNNSGYPGNETTVEDWKKYIQAYKPEYNADIILIDGRFRVACALDIFPKIRSDTIVLMHDYRRKNYHIIENYYIKIQNWSNLASFIKKPNIKSIPKNIYNKYIYIPL